MKSDKPRTGFAGPLANANIPELQGGGEDPAVFGGTSSVTIPPGTEVELPEKGGYRVVEKPKG